MLSGLTLPDEIITDILSRLPVKSVCRFRCVSKPWRALLSQHQFIRTHFDRIRNLQEVSLILISDSHCLFSVPLSNAHHHLNKMTAFARKLSFAGHPDSWTEILASCDGLVFVRDENDKTFLINPTTQEISEVPVSPAPDPCDGLFIMYGLGYDSVSADYKIVALSYYDTGNGFGCLNPDSGSEPEFCTDKFVSVYSVRKGTWKRAESFPVPDNSYVDGVVSGVFVNGYIHWVFVLDQFSLVIRAFDLAEEKFCEDAMRFELDKRYWDYLVELGGCLGLFLSSDDENIVWMMKEYGVSESWTKFTVVDAEDAMFKPLCMFGQEQLMLVKNEETPIEELVMYNLKQGLFTKFEIHGISDDFGAGGTFIFKECLISPKKKKEKE